MKDKLFERARYYIDLLDPEYNILKVAGYRLGPKTTEKPKQKISAALRGRAKPVGSGKFPLEILDLVTGINTIYPTIPLPLNP